MSEGSERVRAGWAPFLEVGRRVSARYALNPRTHTGPEKVSDALGYIVETDAQTITVHTKRGYARIPRGLIVAVREVPPPPMRPARVRDASREAHGT